ncbi:type II toxin-antitoxin system RelE/ParE family toxin [Maricaulis salignorans]|uniref:ParE toxin of type II toxin-antitoxin system, parDE n=1 Tax=Maricaulis salignorans TaxID=144026 RepID=A0A1G9MZM6_9PROT|nr:type II toxin-antitoxin system RelE/ParE family toxin [Maricaulis salignorans]SDL79603.1 ParE toxin of type II toxin-antitoxin system, parDE [Maricaulis salignorans]
MFQLVLTRPALDDLDHIARYIYTETGSIAAAQGFLEKLLARSRSMAASPFELGRPREELGPGIRSSVVGNYLIMTRYQGDVLLVLRYVEGHRALAHLLDEPPDP